MSDPFQMSSSDLFLVFYRKMFTTSSGGLPDMLDALTILFNVIRIVGFEDSDAFLMASENR